MNPAQAFSSGGLTSSTNSQPLQFQTAGNVGVGSAAYPMYSNAVQNSMILPNSNVLGAETNMSAGPNMSTAANANPTNPNPSPAPKPPANNNGGGGVNPNDYGSILNAFPGYSGWNPDAAKADYASTGGAGKGPSQGQGNNNQQSDLLNQIQSAYQGIIDLGNQQQGKISDIFQNQVVPNITNRLNVETQGAQNDLSNTLNTLGNQQNQYNSQNQSAVQQAYSDYNDLARNMVAQYGGTGIGAGGNALAALAQIQGQKNVGSLQQQGGFANAQFANQVGAAQSFYGNKKGQLDQWAQEATTQANQDFQNQLYQITQQTMMPAAQAAQAKLDALNSNRQYLQGVAAQYNQYQQNLGIYAADMLARATGMNFTPADLTGLFSQLQQFSQFTKPVAASFSAPTPNVGGGFLSNPQDYLQQLSNANPAQQK